MSEGSAPLAGFRLDAFLAGGASNAASVSRDYAHPPRGSKDSNNELADGATSVALSSPLRPAVEADARADNRSSTSTLADQPRSPIRGPPQRSHTFDALKNAIDVAKPSGDFVRRFASLRLSPAEASTTHAARRLKQATERSLDIHMRFVPNPKLLSVITEAVVSSELSRSHFSLGKLSRIGKTRIETDEPGAYKRVLAILYLMNRPSKIRLFVKRRMRDEHLPLEKHTCAEGPPGAYELRSRKHPDITSIRFKKCVNTDKFLRTQWTVLVPIFRGPDGSNIPHEDLPQGTILPFVPLQNQSETMKEGGSGRVFKVEIHPDHHCLNKTGVCHFKCIGHRICC